MRMIIKRLMIGIGAFIATVAIMWWTRNKKANLFSEKSSDRKTTTLQEEFPYWGRGVNAELRCSRPDNTRCNAGYDSRGILRRLNQS
jgi:hypothetical protein